MGSSANTWQTGTRGPRRRSRLRNLGSSLGDIAASLKKQSEDDGCAGVLSDFLARLKGKSKQTGMDDKEFLVLRLTKLGLDDAHQEDILGMRHREQLRSSLMESVVKECKTRGLYPRTSPSDFKEQFHEILLNKRNGAKLKTDVANFIMKTRMLTFVPPRDVEGAMEHKHRLEEFNNAYKNIQCGAPLSMKEAVSSPKFSMQAELGGMRWRVGGGAPVGTTGYKAMLDRGQIQLGDLSPEGDGRRLPGHTQRKNLRGSRSLPSLTPSKKISKSSDVLIPVTSSRQSYLEGCEQQNCLPSPLHVCTGHSNKLVASGRQMVDAEVIALCSMAMGLETLEEVNLSNNPLLTDKGLAPLLQAVSKAPQLHTELSKLNLSCLARAGNLTLDATRRVLQGASNLKLLNLSGIRISPKMQLKLCKEVGEHASLEDLNLSETNLGAGLDTIDCIAEIIRSQSIKTLDMSWNSFDSETFTFLGERVSKHRVIEKLSLDSCTTQIIGHDAPISCFVQWLSHDSSLTSLSLAMNRIDFRSALVLEDALCGHPKMKELIVSSNPLGTQGMRSILRLVARESNPLVRFECDDCYSGTSDFEERLLAGFQTYSFTNPGGKYKLNLSRPYHRALLRILYKTCERFKMPADKLLRQVEYSLGSYRHPEKDGYGNFEVPDSGILSVVFSLDACLENTATGLKDDDYEGFLERWFQNVRFRPSWKKAVVLFAKWKQLDGREMEQNVFIDALAKDFSMTPSFLDFMCYASKPMVKTTLNHLLPTVPCYGNARYLAMINFPSLEAFSAAYATMQALLTFNVQNPTGQYKLDLSNSSDFSVAQRLILLDRWESVVASRHNRVDVSAKGNGSNFRNEVHRGVTLEAYSVAEWNLPEDDIFTFDYSSSYRPPTDAQYLSDSLWEELMIELYDTPCRAHEKIRVLRSISHCFFIRGMHMRQMLGYFIIFFLRIVDTYNAKIFMVRFMSQVEKARIRKRLGYMTIFPFLQPENASFDLNLTYNDQRLCARLLVEMAQKEKIGNIREPIYTRPDGSVDKLGMGVPRSWADAVPVGGRFQMTYVCSPEDRQFEFRKSAAEKWGYYECSRITSENVMWWTGLGEAPSDVLDFLEFLIGNFKSVEKAFAKIDGNGAGNSGNGELTLREFEDGLKDIGCDKFKGADEKRRIANVFRYLDPGGEGTVSLAEFRILDQLWKEFDLSIREFVQFLIYAFGEDLEEAWLQLDDDGSGELTEEEFHAAVESIGYFGPAQVVFALLDSTDDGAISYEEFKVLEGYKPAPKMPGP
eukprot:TRINITY_DN9063_c0_g1_i2.p1 TRINITY_DN9063_c0_g1~~TRINITY_DN9063_c0_g1_i2.p1  ORF type:complete len:1400 (+),score=271.00 TRINITY_DN9063_c0_g1_i2:368-4201(+)